MIVVARERPELYEYLRRHLEDIDDIQVVLDRRAARQGAPPGREQRGRQDMSVEMQERGFFMIHLP